MWKKWSIFFLAALLLLTGCSAEASLVRDSVVASMEKPNFEFQGSLKVTGNPEKLPQLFNEKENVELTALLTALKAGVQVSGSETSLQQAKLLFQANDDKLLRDKGLWSGDQKAAVELIVDKNNLYAKTPLDTKYILLDSTANSFSSAKKVDPVKLAQFQDKMNKITMDFIQKYVSKFGYKLSHVKNLGTETVKLPNGDSVKTTHISITLDMKELAGLALYMANDAAANQDVKQFAIDFLTLTTMFNDETSGIATKKTEAEYRAGSQMMVEMGLKQLKQWLDTEGKKYTPDKIVELVKAEGLDAVNWTFDYNIDENKMPVQQKSSLSITLSNKDDKTKQPVTFGLDSESLNWNFGKATKFELPKSDQTVTSEQLKKDKEALKAFNEKGFLHQLIKLTLDQDSGLK